MAPKSNQKHRVSFAKWIRPLRHWWKPLSWIWLTLLLGVGINVASSWLITKHKLWDVSDTPLAWFHDHSTIMLPCAGAFIFLTYLARLAYHQAKPQVSYTSPLHAHQLQASDEYAARQALITQVRKTWITDFLEQSLHHAARIDLHLQDQPDALENPWQFVVQELGKTPRSLPTGTKILQIYDEAQGKLLILGEPGAGKTTLLLQLAQCLLDRAENDEQQPPPVVFHLSTWAASARAAWKSNRPLSFSKWLTDELKQRYGVPLVMAEQWVVNHQLVLLLDGLDEVAAEARMACVEAIIAYQRDQERQGGTRLILCCRSKEFEELARPLPLSTAVTIPLLSKEQVDDYISSAAGQLDGLRHLLRIDPDFAELARSPLVLSIAMLAFQGKRVVNFPSRDNFPAEDNFPTSTSQEQLLQIAFHTYVERVLNRRGQLPRRMQKHFLHWMSYLANQLYQQQQTVFSVESLRPDWLPDSQRPLYRRCSRLVYGLTSALFLWLILTIPTLLLVPVYELASLLILLLILALLGGLAVGLSSEPEHEESSWSLDFSPLKEAAELLFDVLSVKQSTKQRAWLLGGLPLVGLLIGLLVSQMRGSLWGLLTGLALVLSPVLAFVLAFTMLFGLFWWAAFAYRSTLRFWLWRTNCLPWNLVPFLDEAAGRLLLRKVNSGYIFVHRLLLDYFATLDK